jgi:hypothetical protein
MTTTTGGVVEPEPVDQPEAMQDCQAVFGGVDAEEGELGGAALRGAPT